MHPNHTTQEPKKIELTNGGFALVDADDFERLTQWQWHMSNSGYAMRRKWVKTGLKHDERKNTALYMHRLIMDARDGQQVDHIDGDKLNNQRDNLRHCTRSQNHANMQKTKGTSRYKGVSWNTQAQKWYAQTKHNGEPIWIGTFANEVDAAIAYDKKAIELFGEFAKTNFG